MAPLSLSIILLATLTVFCTLNVVCSSDEVDALMKWKSTLRTQNMSILLPSWTYDLNLNFSAKKSVSPCNWFGISCNENGSINRLNLSSSGLKGTLNHLSFSSFPNLMYFELSLNNFSGIIPSEICHLSKLVYLDFSSNQFTAIIPPQIGKLTNLVTLHLFENQLNGSIPQSICQMKFLTEILLSDNNLYGPIPTCFGQLSNLTILTLFKNKLNGSIPRDIGKLTSLRLLRLEINNLTGPIPSSLGKLRSLWCLNLFANKLNGSIPSSFDNQLSGSIPPELGKLRLVQIEFTNNSYSGRLPDGICNGRKLEYLLVGDNKLTGQIPKM
ncbi:putative non-specific serine/threonine protein kinase [Helianthus annuus]|nr:putative non-specific serine/threonine protein kinase [Helianthus annuus]